MPRRESLIAQMYEAHRKAKLQRPKGKSASARSAGRTGQGCGPSSRRKLPNSAGKKNAQLGRRLREEQCLGHRYHLRVARRRR